MAKTKGDATLFSAVDGHGDTTLFSAVDGSARYLENRKRVLETVEPLSFGDLVVARQISWPLFRRRSIRNPWPIQSLAMDFISDGEDVVVRAKPGSGKTLSYLISLLNKFYFDDLASKPAGPFAIIILPTIELCDKVHQELKELTQICGLRLKAAVPRSTEDLSGSLDVVLSTPRVLSFLGDGFLQNETLQRSLEVLVLDEVHKLLLDGFEGDIKSLIDRVPKSCQCLVFSADTSADVKRLKNLVLHNPYVLTCKEDQFCEIELFPYNFHHYYLPSAEGEKHFHLRFILRHSSLGDKVLVFTNSDDANFLLHSFLEQTGRTSVQLLAGWTEESHILQDFNAAGKFDLLIVTDDNQSAVRQPMGMEKKSKNLSEGEPDFKYGVFKNVHTVVHFDMPQKARGYEHRIVSTTRPAYQIGASISLATPRDKDIFAAIKTSLEQDCNLNTKVLIPVPWFPWIEDSGVEGTIYSFEEVETSMYGPPGY